MGRSELTTGGCWDGGMMGGLNSFQLLNVLMTSIKIFLDV